MLTSSPNHWRCLRCSQEFARSLARLFAQAPGPQAHKVHDTTGTRLFSYCSHRSERHKTHRPAIKTPTSRHEIETPRAVASEAADKHDLVRKSLAQFPDHLDPRSRARIEWRGFVARKSTQRDSRKSGNVRHQDLTQTGRKRLYLRKHTRERSKEEKVAENAQVNEAAEAVQRTSTGRTPFDGNARVKSEVQGFERQRSHSKESGTSPVPLRKISDRYFDNNETVISKSNSTEQGTTKRDPSVDSHSGWGGLAKSPPALAVKRLVMDAGNTIIGQVQNSAERTVEDETWASSEANPYSRNGSKRDDDTVALVGLSSPGKTARDSTSDEHTNISKTTQYQTRVADENALSPTQETHSRANIAKERSGMEGTQTPSLQSKTSRDFSESQQDAQRSSGDSSLPLIDGDEKDSSDAASMEYQALASQRKRAFRRTLAREKKALLASREPTLANSREEAVQSRARDGNAGSATANHTREMPSKVASLKGNDLFAYPRPASTSSENPPAEGASPRMSSPAAIDTIGLLEELFPEARRGRSAPSTRPSTEATSHSSQPAERVIPYLPVNRDQPLLPYSPNPSQPPVYSLYEDDSISNDYLQPPQPKDNQNLPEPVPNQYAFSYVLVLRRASLHLDPSDFLRATTQQNAHIPGWHSNNPRYTPIKIIKQRDETTLKPTGDYFLVFTNFSAAYRFMSSANSKHRALQTEAPITDPTRLRKDEREEDKEVRLGGTDLASLGGLRSSIPPPPPTPTAQLTSSPSAGKSTARPTTTGSPPPANTAEAPRTPYHLIAHFTLAPSSQRLHLSSAQHPFVGMVKTVISHGGYPALLSGKASDHEVLLSFAAYTPQATVLGTSIAAMRRAFNRDEEDRGLRWGVIGTMRSSASSSGNEPPKKKDKSRDPIDINDGARLRNWLRTLPLPHPNTPRPTPRRERSWIDTRDPLDAEILVKRTERDRAKMRGRFVVAFENEKEAKRFVSRWHRRDIGALLAEEEVEGGGQEEDRGGRRGARRKARRVEEVGVVRVEAEVIW
ncbi:MAG: hypothetical protein M1828_006100 [Chrysothrix sp. TS-e1954]|nr:MAG: hypothetical protein M1828_006100 [Chrysothrix sp. TS-e1954]